MARCIKPLVLNNFLFRSAFNASRQYSKELEAVVLPAAKFIDVQINSSNGVATVILQRRPVNSLNTEMLSEFRDAINNLERNKCTGMIITSGLPSVFSAGLDILEMYNSKRDQIATFWRTLHSTWLSLYQTSFPTVAVINGACPAGGCVIGLSCEYRIMVGSEKFKIGLNETQLGIVPHNWFIIAMKNVIGMRQTELALTRGSLFSPEEALEIGLIDEIVSNKEAGLTSAEKFIARFENISPLTRQMTKKAVRTEAVKWLQENSVDDTNAFVDFISQPAVQKGLGLYLQSLKK